MRKERQDAIDLGPSNRSPANALPLSQELAALCQHVREQEKEIRQLKELNEFLKEASVFSLPAVRSQQRAKAEIYYAKVSDGTEHKKIAFYCSALSASRQGFYKHLAKKTRSWKYRKLAQAMEEIYKEDPYNDTYGQTWMR